MILTTVRRCFRHDRCRADHDLARACWDQQIARGENPIPQRVANIEAYWITPPPVPSERCLYWQAHIEAGWKRNNRLCKGGYSEASMFFGVWIWEWSNVLWPMLRTGEGYPPELEFRVGDALDLGEALRMVGRVALNRHVLPVVWNDARDEWVFADPSHFRPDSNPSHSGLDDAHYFRPDSKEHHGND